MENSLNWAQFRVLQLRNRYFEWFGRSPRLFFHRLDHYLKQRAKLDLKLGVESKTDTLLWLREEQDFQTRYYLYNYWTENYQVPNIEFQIQLRDRLGKVLFDEKIMLADRETRVFTGAELVKRAGLSLPFLGSFYIRRLTGGRGVGAPVKMFEEYRCGDAMGMIHEYGTLDNYQYNEEQTAVTIYSDEGRVEDIEIGVLNCNGKAAAKDSPLKLYVMDAKGNRKTFDIGNITGAGAALMSLNQIFPAWRDFLGSKPGNILLSFNQLMGRPLVFHRLKGNQAFNLNHTTGDKSRPAWTYLKQDLRKNELGPVWAGAAVFGDEITTAISLLGNFGYDIPYDTRLDCFDQEGRLLRTETIHLDPWETKRIDLSPLFEDMKREPGKFAFGSLRLSVVPQGALGIVPVNYDVNLELVGKGWRQPANTASVLLNVPEDPRAHSRHIQRSRVFVRVLENAQYDTWLLVTNQSSAERFETESDTEFRLISGDGKRELSARRKIAPHGALWVTMKDLFPEAQEFLAASDGVGTVVVRDLKVKLSGFHYTRNKKTGVFAGDHWFGG